MKIKGLRIKAKDKEMSAEEVNTTKTETLAVLAFGILTLAVVVVIALL